MTPLGVYLNLRRNTAPAAAVAAISLLSDDPDAICWCCPPTHDIRTGAFCQPCLSAPAAAQAQWLVVFGVEARSPERATATLSAAKRSLRLKAATRFASFVEKPDRDRAPLGGLAPALWTAGCFLSVPRVS